MVALIASDFLLGCYVCIAVAGLSHSSMASRWKRRGHHLSSRCSDYRQHREVELSALE
jgi:hypothetical protein